MTPLESRLPLAWLFQSTSLSPGQQHCQPSPCTLPSCYAVQAGPAPCRLQWWHKPCTKWATEGCVTLAATTQAKNKWLQKVSLSATEQSVASALSEHLQSNMQGSVN